MKEEHTWLTPCHLVTGRSFLCTALLWAPGVPYARDLHLFNAPGNHTLFLVPTTLLPGALQMEGRCQSPPPPPPYTHGKLSQWPLKPSSPCLKSTESYPFHPLSLHPRARVVRTSSGDTQLLPASSINPCQAVSLSSKFPDSSVELLRWVPEKFWATCSWPRKGVRSLPSECLPPFHLQPHLNFAERMMVVLYLHRYDLGDHQRSQAMLEFPL